ncbi:MAG: RsmB/NOP family class I SAM-dependent RNA methyltransferase [Trueperaceae bacterium]
MARTAAPRSRGRRPTDGAPTDARSLTLRTTRRASRGAFVVPELSRALDGADLSPSDRSFVTDLVYGSLRHRIWIDAALAPRLRDPGALPDEVREALRLGTYEKLLRGTPPHAAVDAWVHEVGRHASGLTGLTNAVLRRVAPPEAPDDAVRASLPTWLWERIHAALGDAAHAAAAAMRAPAPLWLTTYADDAADRLRADGCEVAPGPVPRTLRVRSPRPLGTLAAFRSGAVQPQNPASQAVIQALAPEAAQNGTVGNGTLGSETSRSGTVRVLDLCSGRGIKAAGLASRGADVTAVEIDAAKIAEAQRNLARLGVRVRHRQADLRAVPNTAPDDLPPAPYVLLDAPCSGTGTLRAHPEIALRLGPDDVTSLTELQDRLLDAAVALTAPGGRLVYAVCALTNEEGPRRVDAALDRHPRLYAEAWTPPLPHLRAGAGAFLLPRDGTDGFYVARLRVGR